MFWTPHRYWQLNDSSKFALTIQVLNSRSFRQLWDCSKFALTIQVFKLHLVTDNWTMVQNLHWQFKFLNFPSLLTTELHWQFTFWTPSAYRQLNDDSKFALVNHVLNSTSLLTTERRLQIFSDKSCFNLNILIYNWQMMPNFIRPVMFWSQHLRGQINFILETKYPTRNVYKETFYPSETFDRWFQI